MRGLLQIAPVFRRISRRSLSHHEVTSRFLEFFEGRQHVIVPSSSILAPPETGILFTNSGMNQFYRILSGYETPTVKRVASLQDCVRVGGKHNDLLEVGEDGHHHTFFQMLGNWSFGDYFKDEACSMALELLTSGYRLKKEDLVVTYFGGDPDQGIPPDFETKEIWLKLGLKEEALLAMGKQDNFWDMGKTGPCGPCTEIHVVVKGQLREIWNLVFIQYNRLSDSSLSPLSTPFVDTGMGLERICALLQGKSSNYDTDLFAPLIKCLERETGKAYKGSFKDETGRAFRLVADHCRMAAKAISQGILPENVDSGNKLRRVLRRAAYVAQNKLLVHPGTLGKLSVIAANSLGLENAERIRFVVDEEERRYLFTLLRATKILSNEGKVKTLSGATAWKLYQICGLPKDNIIDICSENGIKEIDWTGFDRHLKEFQKKSVGADPFEKFKVPKHIDEVAKRLLPVTDYSAVYDNQFEMRSEVLYAAQEGPDCVVVTRGTCFYPEGGGQVSDIGAMHSEKSQLEVVKVVKAGDHLLHLCTGPAPPENSTVRLSVDESRRRNCSQHHTATHLLNAAIKKHLGAEAVQRSSLVDDEHFRLDVYSKDAVDVQSVEDFINDAIKSDYAVQCDEVSREDAMNDPSIVKMPNEVYPPRVRLVRFGDVSKEPCCGTHVTSTGDIPPVVILSSRSAGVNMKIVTATASRAGLARKNAEKLRAGVDELDEVSKMLPNDFKTCCAARQRLKSLRMFASKELLPQIDKLTAMKQLDEIEVRILKRGRLGHKSIEPEVKSRLMAFSGNPIIGSIVLDCDETFVRKLMKERGLSQFIILESCGKLHFLCHVSKGESYTARDWAESVVEHIGSPKFRADERSERFCRFLLDPILTPDELVRICTTVVVRLKTEYDMKSSRK